MSRSSSYELEQLTDPAYYILISLLTPRHGYGIMKYISELTEEEVTMGPATLYTLIKKMQKAGYLVLNEDEDERRKTYSLTEKGRSMIENEIERRARMAEHGRIAIEQTKEGDYE
ncbi:PadR family transcriptional regulator [Gorillibacterium timonense]|uniref:PadR family transcriptional regulator n=1 Tax=Gorillibacterium timonense TaxID=1689269 RepID=UPI00071D8520|nr:helix-turn-helix transcriptional regulator [Gorillibacterium timonense]